MNEDTDSVGAVTRGWNLVSAEAMLRSSISVTERDPHCDGSGSGRDSPYQGDALTDNTIAQPCSSISSIIDAHDVDAHKAK